MYLFIHVNVYLSWTQYLVSVYLFIHLTVYLFWTQYSVYIDAHTPAKGAKPCHRQLRTATWLPGLELRTSGGAASALPL